VSKSMYRETLRPAEAHGAGVHSPDARGDTKSKVNTVCDAFLGVMLPKRLSSNLQNIVTAYVCKSPPDHDAALLLIGDLHCKNLELAEQAIQHVCFLSDVNKLYDNALGLYDLELALMVAQQSQKVFPLRACCPRGSVRLMRVLGSTGVSTLLAEPAGDGSDEAKILHR
jgi:elongator complex protein 1